MGPLECRLSIALQREPPAYRLLHHWQIKYQAKVCKKSRCSAHLERLEDRQRRRGAPQPRPLPCQLGAKLRLYQLPRTRPARPCLIISAAASPWLCLALRETKTLR